MRPPEIKNTPLRLTARGYVRQLGTTGHIEKFYLGKDLAQAAQRRQWIEHLYIANYFYLINITFTRMLDSGTQVS